MNKDEFLEVFDQLIGQMTGCRLALVSLAIAMTDKTPISRENMLERLALLDAFATLTESEDAGLALRHIRSMFKALTSDKELAPDAALISLIAMHVDAGPDRKEALDTWLQIASPEEIGADVLQSLRAIVENDRRGD
jgi:hypothetical protein